MAEVTARDASIAANGAFASAEQTVAALIAAKVVAPSANEVVKDISEFVKELGVAFTNNRLEFLKALVPGYPDEKPRSYARTGGGGGGSKGGYSGGADKPASEKQVAFYERLVKEKAGAASVASGDPKTMTSKQISDQIKKLLELDDL